MKSEITKQERNALLLYVHGLVSSPVQILELCHPEQVQQNKYPSSTATRWIQSRKIAAFVEAEKAALQQRQAKHDKAVADKAIAEYLELNEIAGEDAAPGKVDYSNPAARRRLLNRIITAAGDDPKTQLDALKAISTQPEGEDGEGTGNARRKLVRYFVPQTCNSCPLHGMAEEALQLRAAQQYDTTSPEQQARIDEQLRDAGEKIVRKFMKKLFEN